MLSRTAWIVALLTAVVMLGANTWLQFRVDRSRGVITRVLEQSRHCSQLRLLGAREDVLDAMGQPVREEVVPSVVGGTAHRLYYRYSVKTDHEPYVDVDDHFRKIVAIDCAFSKNSLQTVIRKGNVELPKEDALPTSRQRF